MKMKMKFKGFTLIELLVVIAVIGLLIAIIVPALRRAKDVAKRVVCSSSLHQVALGVRAYAGDNDGKLPIYTASTVPDTSRTLYHNNVINMWGNEETLNTDGKERKLTPYLERAIGECPADRGYQPGSSADTLDGGIYVKGNFYEVYGSSYLYNACILDGINGSSTTSLGESWPYTVTEVLYNTKISDIKQPFRLVLVADRTIMYAMYPLTGTDYFTHTKMHDKGSYELNIGYVDGHVGTGEVPESPNHLKNEYYNLVRAGYDRE